MNRFKASLLAIVAAVPFALAACSDPLGPGTTPQATHEPQSLLLFGSSKKHAVEWNSSHSASASVSGVVGPSGGTLSIPGSDFSITFAAGAVSAPTAITITSLAGDYVAYDMQPHGLRFSARVTVTQGLRNTEVYYNLLRLNGLVGAYVDNNDAPASDGTFTPTEILPSVTYLTRLLFGLLVPDRQTWQLNHFSRYMLASG